MKFAKFGHHKSAVKPWTVVSQPYIQAMTHNLQHSTIKYIWKREKIIYLQIDIYIKHAAGEKGWRRVTFVH